MRFQKSSHIHLGDTRQDKRTLIKLVATAGLAPFLLVRARAGSTSGFSTAPELAHANIHRPWFVEAPLDTPLPVPLRDASPAQADASALPRAVHWTRQWLKLVVKYQQNPLRAARSIAHVQVAMHDAWLLMARMEASPSTRELSAHRAASTALQHFYPNETPGFFESQYAWMVAQLRNNGGDPDTADAIGSLVAKTVIERSLRDGAGRTWPVRDRPKQFPGIWQATYPLYAVNPTEAYAGEWRTWLAPSPERYQPPTAPRPGSELHRRETIEVLEVVQRLTARERELAELWHLDAGSVTPAGVWMQHTIDLLARSHPSDATFEASLAVLAAVAVTMEDSLIACWGIKFRDWSERPITAIRRDLDASFTPPLVTPGFPGYVSGHASLSGATSAVLSHFWPTQTFQLDAMATEAAMSRLWGGIHFRSDNEEGLKLGRAVGEEIAKKQTSGAHS